MWSLMWFKAGPRRPAPVSRQKTMKVDVQKTRGCQENTFCEIKTKSTAHLAREFITQSIK